MPSSFSIAFREVKPGALSGTHAPLIPPPCKAGSLRRSSHSQTLRSCKHARIAAVRATRGSFTEEFAAVCKEAAQARAQAPPRARNTDTRAGQGRFEDQIAAACSEAALAGTHARKPSQRSGYKSFEDSIADLKEEAVQARTRQDVILRPITDIDRDAVIALNKANVDFLAPMDGARLRQLTGWSQRFDVVEFEGQFAGFVITFAPGSDYDSVNYRWFAERYPDTPFCYLDRIALAPQFRRGGIGSAVYEQIEAQAAASGCTLVCLEVSIDPPNTGSLAFHKRKGYAEAGRLCKGGQTATMHVKALSE